MKQQVICLFFSIVFGVFYGSAQELPLINQYLPEDYNAESQNWSITQAENGFIFVANNKGLLEFNGAKWNLYPTPNQTIMRSVKASKDFVFTGFYMDFGYWKRDDYGILQYTSLVKKHNVSLLADEQFWNIIELDGWVLFQSLQRIYMFNTQTKVVKVVNSETSISKMFLVDGGVYFQEVGKGVFKIEKGIAKLFSDQPYFKNQLVVLAFKRNQEYVFLTQKNGFYTKQGPYNYSKSVSNFLNNKTVYSATQLKNNALLIGTISNGVSYCNQNGDIQYQLNQKNGLTNNTVLTSFEDNQGNVWLGLDNGINKIDIQSSIRVYKDQEGSLGTVYTSKLFKGNLYLGTNQGLFYKKYPSTDTFTLLKNTQGQVWSLEVVDEKLFCGHNSGTFLINGNQAEQIATVQGTWGIKQINTNTLLQGNYDGLYILKKDKQWELSHKVEGFNNSCKYFEWYHNNTVFINHEYKGVFKLKLNESLTNVIEEKIDSSIVRGSHSSLIKYQNTILYAYKGGVYKFFDKANSFAKDTVLSKLIQKNDFLSGKLIPIQNDNKLVSFSKENINYLRPDKFSSKPVIVRKAVTNSIRKGAVGYENIQKISNEKYLIGSLNGYIITNLQAKENSTYSLSINSIKNYAVNGSSKFLKLISEAPVDLSPRNNNLEFSFSVPYLSKDAQVTYQYQLQGYTDKWSDWSNENSVLFENLSFGDYTFKVRAKIGERVIENTPQYYFSIQRPWYISNLAIAGYVLIVLLFSVFMDRVYKRYYQKQREAILQKQEREFQLKTLESEKELIEIKNEQLKRDVETKNRELAASTMSMVKRNELLSSLRKEILKGDEKSLKNVIKIIDKNLNNTDDWQMFEEAFNNADKDFIGKIKKKHDNLTPNDLRLCAYLRLNLSSKEIAPLLNISPRSVEVKRYRLRKKMNLPHDVNLTSYILEV